MSKPVLPLENILADLEQGMRIKDVLKKYQIRTRNQVYALIERNKMTHLKPSRQCVLSLPLEDMQSDLEQGMSVKEICKKYQTYPGTVYTLIHQNKLIHVKPSKQRVPSMQKDLNKGISVQAVADKHQVTKQYVYFLIGKKELKKPDIKRKLLKQLQTDINAGMSVQEIGKKHKIATTSIYRDIRKKLLIRQNPKQERLKSIQADLDQGMRIKDISQKYDMAVGSLYFMLSQNVLKRPEVINHLVTKERKRLPIADIQADLNQGMSYREISEKYDVFSSYLSALLKKGTLIKSLSSAKTGMPFALTKMDILNLALEFYPNTMESALRLAAKMTNVEDKRMLFTVAKEAIAQNISEHHVFYALNHAHDDSYKLAVMYGQGSLAAVVALHKKIAYLNKDALNLARSKHPEDVQEFVKAAMSIQKFLEGQSTSVSGKTASDQEKSAHRTVRTMDLDRMVADLQNGFSKAEAAKRQGFHPDVGRKAFRRAIQTGKLTEDMLPSGHLISSTT
jgi:Mor family transcriptional regulator